MRLAGADAGHRPGARGARRVRGLAAVATASGVLGAYVASSNAVPAAGSNADRKSAVALSPRTGRDVVTVIGPCEVGAIWPRVIGPASWVASPQWAPPSGEEM